MREIKTDFIEKVIKIMKSNELTELMLEDEKNSLLIRTNSFNPVIQTENKTEIKTREKEEELQEEKETDTNKLFPVISNMIGMFYLKPSPADEPFIKVGDRVKAGQQICIIETIKLINKIEAEVTGTIKEICIENGKPVEYGQIMMYIEQD